MRNPVAIAVMVLCAVAACSQPARGFLFFWGKDQPYRETSGPRGFRLFLRPVKKDPARQLAYANQLAEAGRARAAARQYRALVTYWPDSPEAAEAQYRYAQHFDRRGATRTAFDEYQRLFERYTGYFPYQAVLERQFELAKQAVEARQAKFWIFPGFSAPERAIPMLEKVVLNGPQWDKAPEAQYLIGKAHEKALEYELAIDAYMTAQNRYPDHPVAEQAAFGAAHAYFRLAQESPYNERLLDAAWAAVTLFLKNYPDSEHAEMARAQRQTLFSQRARLAYEKARFYERARRPRSALIAYENFVRAYPQSDWTELARARIAALQARLGDTELPASEERKR